MGSEGVAMNICVICHESFKPKRHTTGKIVHHVDGNKLNNDPGNLAVMTQAEHMREHGLGIPDVRPIAEPWKYRRYR